MRVIIAEDSVLLREGIARLLTENGFNVVETVEDGEALIRRIADLAPDVAVIDIRMPPSHTDEGLRAGEHIRAYHTDVGVLLLSQHAEVGIAMKLLEGGADGVAVEKHVSSIFDKLQLPATKETHRRVLAVLALLRH